MTVATSAAALVTAISNYGSAVINRRKAGGQFTGPAYTKPTDVAFSTTPVFDASTSNVFHFGVMTNNVPGATVTNGADGQTVTIRLVQDATGGRVFTVPGNVVIPAASTPVTTANAVNLLNLTYNAGTGKWEGVWVPVS